jgi:hypothetical protein
MKTKTLEINKPQNLDTWKDFQHWFERFLENKFPKLYNGRLSWVTGGPSNSGQDGELYGYVLAYGQPDVIDVRITPDGNIYRVTIAEMRDPGSGIPDIFTSLVRKFKEDFVSNKEEAGRKSDEGLTAKYKKGKAHKKKYPGIAEAEIAEMVGLEYHQWKYQKRKENKTKSE